MIGVRRSKSTIMHQQRSDYRKPAIRLEQPPRPGAGPLGLGRLLRKDIMLGNRGTPGSRTLSVRCYGTKGFEGENGITYKQAFLVLTTGLTACSFRCVILEPGCDLGLHKKICKQVVSHGDSLECQNSVQPCKYAKHGCMSYWVLFWWQQSELSATSGSRDERCK